MSAKNLSVKFAEITDSKNISECRNDPITRRMSHTSEIIRWKQHTSWFINSLKSKNRILLICKQNSVDKIAVVRFDIFKITAKVSINLNPKKRNKNFGKICLIKSIDFFLKKYPRSKKIYAEVKRENISSKKIFLGAGFKKYKVGKKIEYYIKIYN